MAKRKRGRGALGDACTETYMIELANKSAKGRAVGNEWVVTQRPLGRSGILARFAFLDEAKKWIRDRCR